MSSVTTIAMPNRYASFGQHAPLLPVSTSPATTRDVLPSPIKTQQPHAAPANAAAISFIEVEEQP